jgi:hypothetical protein
VAGDQDNQTFQGPHAQGSCTRPSQIVAREPLHCWRCWTPDPMRLRLELFVGDLDHSVTSTGACSGSTWFAKTRAMPVCPTARWSWPRPGRRPAKRREAGGQVVLELEGARCPACRDPSAGEQTSQLAQRQLRASPVRCSRICSRDRLRDTGTRRYGPGLLFGIRPAERSDSAWDTTNQHTAWAI